MAITVAPLPPNSDLGIGFWIDLKEKLATAISCIEENTESDDSHGASSNSLEVIQAFDPDVHTVTEFLAAVEDILGSLEA